MTEAGELLRALTIDPTRDYQPLNGRWPVDNVLRQASGISWDRTMAGAVGFEPTYGGSKVRCLTTWRRPNGSGSPTV